MLPSERATIIWNGLTSACGGVSQVSMEMFANALLGQINNNWLVDEELDEVIHNLVALYGSFYDLDAEEENKVFDDLKQLVLDLAQAESDRIAASAAAYDFEINGHVPGLDDL
jgi:hypothetical protein